MMAYKSTYHEDSDADDEYERTTYTSPTLPQDFESSPTDSDPPSAEHTPTTYTHSRGSHDSPVGKITQWSAEQCADFVSSLGLEQYADTFVEEAITGEALVSLEHDDLKDMGVNSIGHRLTVLKSVYDIKVKQNIAIEEGEYVPLSAEAAGQDTTPTQDDIARIIDIIKERDKRIQATEAELRLLKDDLNRVAEENKRLREDVLPVVRMVKDRSHPLPLPNEEHASSPPLAQPDNKGSSLSRKFSTKKLFLGSAPKNPSPTIHEGRTLNDSSNLDPSAAAMAASSHLTASLSAGQQPQPSPHLPQPSPTSPAYTTQTIQSNRNFPRGEPSSSSRSNFPSTHQDDYSHTNSSNWSSSSTLERDTRNATPAPLTSRRQNTSEGSEPSSGGGALTPNTTSSTVSSSSNPQVEIFKSFRVSIDDPCHKVLPVALRKYNITADWRQYALYIVHGDQERCLGLNERPLILFKQLDKEGRKPMFMLRKHAAPAEGHVSTIPGGAAGQGASYGGQGYSSGAAVQLPGGVL